MYRHIQWHAYEQQTHRRHTRIRSEYTPVAQAAGRRQEHVVAMLTGRRNGTRGFTADRSHFVVKRGQAQKGDFPETGADASKRDPN